MPTLPAYKLIYLLRALHKAIVLDQVAANGLTFGGLGKGVLGFSHFYSCSRFNFAVEHLWWVFHDHNDAEIVVQTFSIVFQLHCL